MYNDGDLFAATIIMSILSASKGLTTFLKDGPCPLLPKKGFCGGYGHCGFILLFFNICFTLVGKGMCFASLLASCAWVFENVVKAFFIAHCDI